MGRAVRDLGKSNVTGVTLSPYKITPSFHGFSAFLAVTWAGLFYVTRVTAPVGGLPA